MENAGKGVAEVIKDKYSGEKRHVVIFAGHGNNGGDGLVAGRYLAEEFPVLVLFFGWRDKLSEESELNYEKIEKAISIIEIENKDDLENIKFQSVGLILVDAMLGTGVKGEIREPISSGIELFNSLEGEKFAIDIPTGINPDTGEGDEHCKVDEIICLHDIKQGLEKVKDKVVVVDIGIE